MTPENEKHFEINRRLILAMQAMWKEQSAAKQFLRLVNLHYPLNHRNWRMHQKKLEAAVEPLLKQNFEEVANKLEK